MVLTSISLANTWSGGATSSVPVGLPIYQFVDSGTGPLPWNALSLESLINHTTMLGGPHTASNATEGVVAYRTNRGDLALLTQSTASSPHWTNLSSGQHLPAPAADPIPFFDPSGNVDLLYVDSDAHVILLSQNDPVNQLWHNLRRNSAWRAYVPTDLSDLSGVVASNGLASIVVNGLAATVAYRTAANGVEVLPLGWGTGHPVPFLTGNPGTVAGTSSTSPTPSHHDEHDVIDHDDDQAHHDDDQAAGDDHNVVRDHLVNQHHHDQTGHHHDQTGPDHDRAGDDGHRE